MRVSYLLLENFAVLYVGQGKDFIEIHFPKSGNKIVSIQGVNGKGKAQPVSTKIPTPDGYKLMGDIKVGDKVFGSDGEPINVIGVFPQGIKDIYKITFSDGRTALCCKEHLWNVYSKSHGKNKLSTLTLEEILKDYKKYLPEKENTNHDKYGYRYRIQTLSSPVQYNHQDVPIDPYILGAFIGNGCLRDEQLSISSGNEHIPKMIAKKCNFEVKRNSIHNYTYKFYDSDSLGWIRTDDFFCDIPEMVGVLSYNKRIPDIYLYNDYETRIELLRGLMDTDGNISYNDGRYTVSYSSSSEELLLQIQQLIRGLGFNGNITLDKRLYKYTNGYHGILSFHVPNNFKKNLFSLSHKVILASDVEFKLNYSRDYNFLTIKNIEFSHKEEAKCIRVDAHNQLYATEDFIITHNSGLIANVSPFAYPTSIDERSALSVIREGKNGYKEIHYIDKGNKYIIKHYYKANKTGGHSVKSYFSLNGEELNDNGNVTSFNSLVEIHLGLTQEMMRLLRLGSNVNSFISLTPARRKEYIGSLIEEIDMYMKIYKKINDDIRIIKVLLSSNSTNMYNCHIADLIVEEERLENFNRQIREYERDRDKIISKISEIKSLERENDIEDLKRKRREAEASMFEFEKTEESIMSLSLQDTTMDQLINKRSDLVNKRIDIQSKINSYRISIDTTLKNIERLELSIKKVASNNDLESLINVIESLKETIKRSDNIIGKFTSQGCTSEDVYHIISKLSSFNQISQMVQTFGNKPINIYLKLRRENKSVDKFLKEQMKRNLSRVSDNDLKRLLSQVFQEDEIITPNCDSQFEDCPYYRFSETVNSIKDKLDEESYDDETLRYIQVISNNVDNILNELDIMASIKIPDRLRDDLRERPILTRLESKLPFFDLSGFQEFLTVLREYEIYQQNVEKLKQYEHQLSIYKKSGIDNQINEIKDLQENITFYKNNITVLTKEIENISSQLSEVDNHIGLVTKYTDGKKYQKMIKSTLESTNKILGPLESAARERMELQYKLNSTNTLIDTIREDAKRLENRINEYNRLVTEEKVLSRKHRHLNMILETVSTKKGIPVAYMKIYLGKIQKLANNLLRIIYGDELQLAKFKITQETFEIPYIKNGTNIPDVKYASQSEAPLINMALSFALSNNASKLYNILLLDEMDAGFDERNRSAFLKILAQHMRELHAEQVFIISHNLNNIIDIPIDVIRLSDVGANSKLQNVIYENE